MRQLNIIRRKYPKNEKGTYLVEFAIVAPAFLFLLFGVMEFGRAIWAYNSIAHAAREGVRFAIVRGEESSQAATAGAIETYVKSRSGVGPVQVTTTWQPNNKPGSVVQVKVDYSFQPSVPFIPSIDLTSTSKMVISF